MDNKEKIEKTLCYDCDILFERDKLTVNKDGNSICDKCIEHYVECQGCGGFIQEEDIYSCEWCDSIYCESCFGSNYARCCDMTFCSSRCLTEHLDNCGVYNESQDCG